MRICSFCIRSAMRALLMMLCLLGFACPFAHALGGDTIKIVAVYGAGGLSGASYRQDFITLFNPTLIPITAQGWAIQTRSSSSTSAFGHVYQLPDFTLNPGQYYLIVASAPEISSYGTATPITADYQLETLESQQPGWSEPDTYLEKTQNILSSTAETVALTSSTNVIPASTQSSCASYSWVVDMVGYGSSNNCYLGAGAAPYTSNRATYITRKDVCTDTQDNAADFENSKLSSAAFQNSQSNRTPCSGTASSAGFGINSTDASGHPMLSGGGMVIQAGLSMTVPIALTSYGGYTGTIALSCSGLPAPATCSMGQSSFTVTADGTKTFKLSIQTGTASSTVESAVLAKGCAPLFAFGVLSSLLLSFTRKGTAVRRAALFVLLLSLSATLMGCGGASAASTSGIKPGSYSLIVKATDGVTTHILSNTIVIES